MLCNYHQAGLCRSCTELPVPYAEQLRAKGDEVRRLLAAHPHIEWLPVITSAEAGFRNKAKMVVSGTIARPILGIRNHMGIAVDLSDCPLYPSAIRACFPAIAEFITVAGLEPYDVTNRRGELKFILLTLAEHSGDCMLRFVLRSHEAIARIRKHLPGLLALLPGLRVVSVNVQPEHKAVLEGAEEVVLTAERQIEMRINGLPLHLAPRSFFQTNSCVAAALYAQTRDWTDSIDPSNIWDLYCGVGGFALHVANGVRRVVGIESSAEAIASARRSRDEIGIAGVRFEVGDATAFVGDSNPSPDLVIVNPPRRGIGPELSRWLETSSVQHLIYSSCNGDSLARDLAMMPSWVPRKARLLDMFPHTRHYEVLVLLDRVRLHAS